MTESLGRAATLIVQQSRSKPRLPPSSHVGNATTITSGANHAFPGPWRSCKNWFWFCHLCFCSTNIWKHFVFFLSRSSAAFCLLQYLKVYSSHKKFSFFFSFLLYSFADASDGSNGPGPPLSQQHLASRMKAKKSKEELLYAFFTSNWAALFPSYA